MGLPRLTHTLFKALERQWRLQRSLFCNAGTMMGPADFVKQDAFTLRYYEKGTFVTNSGEHLQSYRNFIYRYISKEIEILFDDPHRKNDRYVTLHFQQKGHLSLANDTHLCEHDQYQHKMVILDHDRWCTRVNIKGPKKNQIIETRYER